jgi:hypothetical protein
MVALIRQFKVGTNALAYFSETSTTDEKRFFPTLKPEKRHFLADAVYRRYRR